MEWWTVPPSLRLLELEERSLLEGSELVVLVLACCSCSCAAISSQLQEHKQIKLDLPESPNLPPVLHRPPPTAHRRQRSFEEKNKS